MKNINRTDVKIYICCLFFLSAIIKVYPDPNQTETSNTVLDIQASVNLALKNNPLIKQAAYAVDASSARLGQSKGDYYPDISIDAQYTRIGPDPAIAFPGLGSFQFFPENNYDIHLGLHQMLLDFGKTSSIVRAGKAEVSAARENLGLVKINIAYQTIQSFYAVLLLQESINVQQKQIDTLNGYLAMIKNKIESGSATSFDLLTTQVKVSESENTMMDLKNQLHKQKILSKRLMGLDDNIVFEFKGTSEKKDFRFDEEKFIEYAMKNRSEIKIATVEESIAEKHISSLNCDYLPVLSAGGSYGLKNGHFPDMDELRNNTVLFMQASVNLFDGMQTSNRVKEAEAGLSSAREHSRDIRDTVAAEIRQKIDDVNTSIEKLNASDLHVKLAQQAVEQAKVRYESGVITNLELLNAETALDQANLMNLQSLYGYVINSIALKKAAGMNLLE